VAACGISIAACAPNPKTFATVAAFCEALPEQKTAIAGKTVFDQPWIDDTSEAVIAGCNRERPAPRPAHWDGPAHIVAGKAVPLPAPQAGTIARARAELARRLKKRAR